MSVSNGKADGDDGFLAPTYQSGSLLNEGPAPHPS